MKASEVLNIVAGFPASVLTHAEMEGLPCLLLTAIIDSHFVTEETLRAFSTVAKEILDN